MMFFKPFLALVVLVWSLPQLAYAILPPDMIFSVGSQIAQFFSFITLVVGGVLTSVLLMIRRFIPFSGIGILKLVGLIFGVVILIITIIYFVDKNKQITTYKEKVSELEEENKLLQANLDESVSFSEYQRLLSILSENDQILDDYDFATSSDNELNIKNKNFYSDTFTLYSNELEEPFILEIDFNRMEKAPGLFTHYTFLNGIWEGVRFADYDSLLKTSSEVQPNEFVENFVRTNSPDLLNREQFEMEVKVKGEPLWFSVERLEGDFITRNYPAYIQYDSVSVAKVKYKGKEFTANVLVEGVYSNDYSKYIFFPEYNEVEAVSHQFILWDEQNNFYMIDNSDVSSDTKAYTSHNWLLYKNKQSKILKKSFESKINTLLDDSGNKSWEVSILDFDKATIKLSDISNFKQGEDNRDRLLVSGTIKDDKGERSIGGILHVRH